MADIPFVRDIEFEYGVSQTLSPLVSRVMCENPGPFTYTGTGTFLIGNQEVAIIDPGPCTPAHKHAIERALLGKQLTHIFVTHHHADHSPLARPLSQTYGIPITGRPAPHIKAQTDNVLEEGNDPNFKPDIIVGDGAIFHAPEWAIEAVFTPGHTSNHVCYALHSENTLFSGDHIMGWATSVVIPPDGHMGSYLESLDKVKKLGFNVIRPTHGPAITDVDPFLSAYIAHRHAREDQIFASVCAGHTNIMAMVKSIYNDIDPRLYPAAALSVLSHLTYLVDQGKVLCDGVLGLSGVYTPA